MGFGLFLLQQGPHFLDVSCHHGQGHIPLKAVDAMIETSVEAMHFEGIDGRFHTRVLVPCNNEGIRGFEGFLLFGAPAFGRQDGQV